MRIILSRVPVRPILAALAGLCVGSVVGNVLLVWLALNLLAA